MRRGDQFFKTCLVTIVFIFDENLFLCT
jgi:hypothetical protein